MFILWCEAYFVGGWAIVLQCYYSIEIKWYLFDLQTNWNLFACSYAWVSANRIPNPNPLIDSFHSQKLFRYDLQCITTHPFPFSLFHSLKFVSILRILESSVCDRELLPFLSLCFHLFKFDLHFNCISKMSFCVNRIVPFCFFFGVLFVIIPIPVINSWHFHSPVA